MDGAVFEGNAFKHRTVIEKALYGLRLVEVEFTDKRARYVRSREKTRGKGRDFIRVVADINDYVGSARAERRKVVCYRCVLGIVIYRGRRSTAVESRYAYRRNVYGYGNSGKRLAVAERVSAYFRHSRQIRFDDFGFEIAPQTRRGRSVLDFRDARRHGKLEAVRRTEQIIKSFRFTLIF